MIGLSFIAACAVSLLCTTQQGQATETCMALHGCSTEEMRRAELKRVLDNSGCNNYSCGKPSLVLVIRESLIHAGIAITLHPST